MRKLHIKEGGEWKPVFCHMNGKVITCNDKNKALPTKSIWADDDLKFFSAKFGNNEFRLM